MNTAIDGLMDDLAEILAERVVRKLTAATVSDYVDQASSPLGPRRHIAAIKSGKLAGVRVGRRYLAHRKDVEELVAQKRRQARPPERLATIEVDAVDALAAELGLDSTSAKHSRPRARVARGKRSP